MKHIIAMCCLVFILMNGCIGIPPTKKEVYEDPETRGIKTVDEKTDMTLLQAGTIVVVGAAFIVMLMFHDQTPLEVTDGIHNQL